MSRYSERDDDRGSRRREDDDRGSRRSRDEDDDRGRRSRGRDDDDRGSRRSRDDDDDDRGSRRSESSSGYRYESRDPDATKRRGQRGSKDFDKFLKPEIKLWKVNDGDNRVRILPPGWKGADHYGIDLYVHYGVGPDRQSYLCPNKHNGDPCPICEERQRARDDGDDEYAKELDVKRRTLVYVVDRDHAKDGVQAWPMSYTIDNDIIKVSQDKQSGQVLEIDHPEEGYDVEFEKNGQGLKTRYEGVTVSRRSSSLGKDEWLDYAVDHPLPDQLVFYSYDEIAKAFGAQGSQRSSRDRDRDDRDDDRGSRSRDRDDDRPSRRPERDDDDRGSRSESRRGSDRGRNADPDEPTWESVHEMTKSELEDLIDEKELDINPKDAKDTEDLADWICEEMKLTKSERRERVKEDPEDGGRRRRASDEDDDRLAEMRERRTSRDADDDGSRRRRSSEDDEPRRRRRED